MKAMIALFVLAFATATASAADTEKKAPSAAQQAQREKMKSCNAEAAKQSLKGDERKTFMSSCLGAKPAATETAKTPAADAAAAPTQQNRMKSCNKEAGEKALKGAERKTFMSECLKG